MKTKTLLLFSLLLSSFIAFAEMPGAGMAGDMAKDAAMDAVKEKVTDTAKDMVKGTATKDEKAPSEKEVKTPSADTKTTTPEKAAETPK
jgi:hypothetical protein